MRGYILLALCFVACVGLARGAASKTEVVQYLCGKPDPFAGITPDSHCAKAAEMMAEFVDKDTATCPAHYAEVFASLLGHKRRQLQEESTENRIREEHLMRTFEDLVSHYVTAQRAIPGLGAPSFLAGFYAPSLQQVMLALIELWLVGFGGPYGTVVNGWGLPLSGIPYVMNSFNVPGNSFYSADTWVAPPALPASGNLQDVQTNSVPGQLLLNTFQNAVNTWNAVAQVQSQDAGGGLHTAVTASNGVDPFLSGRQALIKDLSGVNGVQKQIDGFNSWITSSLMTVCSCLCDSDSDSRSA